MIVSLLKSHCCLFLSRLPPSFVSMVLPRSYYPHVPPYPAALIASDWRKHRRKWAQTLGWHQKYLQPSHLMAHVFGISGARAFADSSGGVSHEYAKSQSCQVARSWSGRRSRTAQPGVVVEIWAFSAQRTSFIFYSPTGARQRSEKLGYIRLFAAKSTQWHFWVFGSPAFKTKKKINKLIIVFLNAQNFCFR